MDTTLGISNCKVRLPVTVDGGGGRGAVRASSASSTSAAANALPECLEPLSFAAGLMTPSSLCSKGQNYSRSAAGGGVARDVALHTTSCCQESRWCTANCCHMFENQ
jgi:hypothetical protein